MDLDILTDSTGFSKADMIRFGGLLVAGCVATNTNFTFSGTSYTLLDSRYTLWVSKNNAGELLHPAYAIKLRYRL